MKTRAEQITDMGWLMCPRELEARCGDCQSDTIGCTYKIKAEALYDAGYGNIEEAKRDARKEFADKVIQQCFYDYDEILPSLFEDTVNKVLKEYEIKIII